MSSFFTKTPTAVYSLLVQPETDMDLLLTQSNKLKREIERVRTVSKRNVTMEIKELDEKIKSIENSQLPDSTLLASLKAKLAILLQNYKQITTPTIDSIKTHTVWLNRIYKPFIETVFEYTKQPASTLAHFGGDVVFQMTEPVSSFLSEQTIHFKISQLTPQSSEDKVRWANMLGHRLIKDVKLFINNTQIDAYNGEFYNAYYETRVYPHKQKAWLQCIGHELPMESELLQDPVSMDYKEKRWICDGLQTIKSSHSEFELFIPLLFWFNLDRRDALFVAPNTKIEIRISLQDENKLMTCVDVEADIYHERYNSPYIINCDLYTNHIYVNKEVENLFISRIGFNLVRVHQFASITIDKNKDAIDLDRYLRFAIEDVTIYARPLDNEEGIDSLNTWHRNASLEYIQINTPVIFKDVVSLQPQIGMNTIKLYKPTPLFDQINLSYDGVSPYGSDSQLLYSAFMPLYADNTMCGDNNIYYITYSNGNKATQPMGYANMSKSRRIVFEYSSTVIENIQPVVLYVHASAINFLIYDNRSAALNFAV